MSDPKTPITIEMLLEVPGVEPKVSTYSFQQKVITIGRDENSDIQIPLSTASRNHALIKHEDGQWYIEDLKSTHGTERNGTHLGSGGIHLLRPGDQLKIIHMTLTYVVPKKVSAPEIHENPSMAALNIVDDLMANLGGQADLPYLRVMNGPAEGQKFEIRPDLTEALVGRADECHFQINDANVSRQHARIHRDWNDITVHDLGSKNGVLVNNKKIGKGKRLKDADQILLGAVRLTFVDPTAAILQTLEGLPAFARDEESIEGSAADIDLDQLTNDEDTQDNTNGSEPPLFNEDLDENSIAAPLESISNVSPSEELALEEASSINTMPSPEQNGKETNLKSSSVASSGLGTAEKSLIVLSILVFISLIAILLIFTFTD